MNRKGILLAVALVAGGVWLAIASKDRGTDSGQMQRILKENKRAGSGRSFDESASSQGTEVHPREAVPLPNDFVSAKVPPEGYWFVGKFEDGPGVEIPFRPGAVADPPADGPPSQPNPGYVGPESCRECHADIYDRFVQTGHAKTFRPVTSETIDGCFLTIAEASGRVSPPGSQRKEPTSSQGKQADLACGTLQTRHPSVRFEMLRDGEEYLQRVHFYDWRFDVPMQLIMGSSKMAQTYLYWHGDRLYQHNVTHVTSGDRWVNSPGYIDGDAAYARPVPERCLDCHATYFDFRGSVNRYTPDSLILGVSCERCHGPAQEHVKHHRENPDAAAAFAITHPANLTRQQQLDICGQCHAGSSSLAGPAMRFRPGDAVSDFYDPEPLDASGANTVHASNQLTRLAESECYINTSMTCSDCHNPHDHERDQVALFSQRCQACHETKHCGMEGKVAFDLADNCIDCHMPTRPTKDLRLKSVEGDVFPPLRDHKIRVDEEATQKFLESRERTASE